MKPIPKKLPPANLGTCKMLLERIPVHVKAEFKATCARRAITMQEATTLFFRHADTILSKLKSLERERKAKEAADALAP